MSPSARLFLVAVSCAILLMAASPAIGQTVPHSLIHQDQTRFWWELVPSSYDGSAPAPLVLVLHGRGGNGMTFGRYSGWNPVAQEHGFIAVYPTGGIKLPIPGTFAWNSFVFDGSQPDDAGFLIALIDHLKQQYNIDSHRVFITGFSNGAMMAVTMACMHTDRLAAIGPVSGGWMPAYGASQDDCQPSMPLPVWIWRGQDETISGTVIPMSVFEQDQMQLQYWLNLDQTDFDPVSSQVSFDHAGLTYVYLTDTYRGGDAEVRYTIVQDTGHEYFPDTAQMMWTDFFSRFPLPPAEPAPLVGDINFNGRVDGVDLGLLLAAWGTPAIGSSFIDLNNDGTIDGIDLGMLLANWTA